MTNKNQSRSTLWHESSLTRRSALAVFGGTLLEASTFTRSAAAGEANAVQIMEKNFVVSKVPGATQDVSMELVNSQGQKRVRSTFSATKLQPNGTDSSRVVKFLSPSDVRGTATLLVEHSSADDDIWIYLPALKKVRRLVASNKKDSFVGTDFSYGDIIGYKVLDWQHRIVKEDSLDGAACFVIESVPKSAELKSNSGYSKRQSWIRKDNLVALKVEIWDTSDKPLKVLRYSDVRQVDAARQKWQPMTMEARNSQTGHKTVIRFSNYKLEAAIGEDMFTTRYLERDQ
ncbi:MAG TPA: outer membrane lipoprotein-sorting protein [Polyangiaceae bacterium]|nr:outer membrane lipoprotein-sorting protein [Polyangiaceae bacterium]